MSLQILNRRGTHAGQLERWLGSPTLEQLSLSMKDWYGPPIAVAGVPGNVWAMKGGDFRGPISAGKFTASFDVIEQRIKRMWKQRDELARRWARRQLSQCNSGFADFSDLIAQSQKGGRKDYIFQKQNSVSTTTGFEFISLWKGGDFPVAGLTASAAPGGNAPTSTTTGAFTLTNPPSGETQHFVGASLSATSSFATTPTLLLYDRIFQVAKTMNDTGTEAVSGVPTRYQSTTPSDMNYAGGNFLFPEVFTSMSATAHNWTVCTYTDQGGNGSTLPSVAGFTGGVAQQIDLPLKTWFAPLEAGDIGIQTLTQMQCSALVASGALNFIIGHPIAWMPCPITSFICQEDGIYTAFNLVRIFDDACLSFLCQPTTNQLFITRGVLTTVAG